MQIRILQLLDALAGTTLAAGIRLGGMFAVQILREGKRRAGFSDPGRAVEQEGMGQLAASGGETESVMNGRLARNLGESRHGQALYQGV